MYVCMFCEGTVNAPQLIELSAQRNTFYSKKEYVCMYVKISRVEKEAELKSYEDHCRLSCLLPAP